MELFDSLIYFDQVLLNCSSQKLIDKHLKYLLTLKEYKNGQSRA